MLKKITLTILILSLLFSNLSPVYAQDLSPAPLVLTPTPEIEIQPNPIASASATPTTAPEQPVIPSPSPTLPPPSPTLAPIIDQQDDITNQSGLSAQIKKLPKLQAFSKSVFSPAEKISTRLLYGADETANITFKYNGKASNLPFVREIIGSDLDISVNPPRTFQPGKYQLQIETTKDLQYQEFNLANLALNFDKSIYSPGDLAQIGIGVSDDQGLPVCDAHLTLKIDPPDSDQNQTNSITLASSNQTISVNPACQKHLSDQKADYTASVSMAGPGIYDLTLTASTKKGTYSLTDQVKVSEALPFTIVRQTPQRINTAEKFPVLLNITAQKDFRGQIIDTVPQDLTVIPPEVGQKYDFVKLLTEEYFQDENIASSSSVISITNPFTGTHSLTQYFGQNVTDPMLKRQYILYGNIGHDGLDYSLPEGTPVIAADSGFITQAGWGPYGNTVIIMHSWGQTYYGHLSRFQVQPNQYVSKGELIAYSGDTGLSTGPHLHFGLRLNDYDFQNGYFGKVDPLLYLNTAIIPSSRAVKQIAWSVNLKAGESIELGYLANAPQVASQAYLLGPLKLVSENSEDPESSETIFQETRYFQISADQQSIKFMDSAQGQVKDLADRSLTQVSTNTKLTAAYNNLYLAAVAVTPNVTIDKIDGLGLSWHPLAGQCSANNSTNLALFWAQGAPTEDSFITAYLNANIPFSGEAAIAGVRYSGVDPHTPLGNLLKANTIGRNSNAICESLGQNSENISLSTSTSQPNSVIFSAVSANNNKFTPGQLTNLRGNSSLLSIQDQSVYKIEKNIPLTGTFASAADWSLITVEIIADANKPKNLMRHGKWFNGSGTKQPFSL